MPPVIQWLKRYPTIKIVARDRSKEFAAAITAALPQARHVADRWHVAKNLTEQLDEVVSARWKQLTKAVGEVETPPEPALTTHPASGPRQPVGEARYQQMLVLAQAGLPTETIAKRLGVEPRTIQRWRAQEQLDHLCQMDNQLAQARELTHGFLDLMRRHTAEGLDAWLKDVHASTLRQFVPFARSIERDKAALGIL